MSIPSPIKNYNLALSNVAKCVEALSHTSQVGRLDSQIKAYTQVWFQSVVGPPVGGNQ